MKLPLIKYDCKHFFGDRPCMPNKMYGIFCECEYYEKETEQNNETDSKLELKPFSEHIENIQTIIIIKLDAAGDVLRTTSILPSLKASYPSAEITWITKEKSYTYIKDNQLIDKIFITDSEELEQLFEDEHVFDIAINLDSSKESCDLMLRLDAAVSFGFTIKNGKPWPCSELANEWYLMGVNDKIKRANNKTYHKLIHEICGLNYNDTKPELAFTDEIEEISTKYRDQLNIKKYDEFILINLGGGKRWQNKKWTAEGYSELVNKLSSKYPDKLFGVIAGDEERGFYDEVTFMTDKNSNVAFLGFNNSAEEFKALIYLCDKILTSDSLAMHIATAYNKYIVVLVGPTSYTELDVFGKGVIIHSPTIECKCYYAAVCTEDINCMNTITTNMVSNALRL